MRKLYLLLPCICLLALFTSCEDTTTDGTGKSVNLLRDLALYYSFDNSNVNDQTTNHYDGIATPDVEYITDTPSGKGKALYLDGTSNQYVNIPYRIGKDSTNLTVSVWLKDFGTGVIFTTMQSNSNSLGCPTLYINTNCRLWFCGEYFGYPLQSYQSSGWHMITTTASDALGVAKLYLDGKLVDNMEVDNVRFSGDKMQIGGNCDGYFKAYTDPMFVDNLRVYRRCLNEKEVKELYNKERQ